MFINIRSVGLVLGVAVLGLSDARADVTISLPTDGSTVCAMQRIVGKLTPEPGAAGTQIWIVINPLDTPGDYWPQDPLTANSKGDWQGTVHFGSIGLHNGLPFQFRAFVEPNPMPHVGKVMPGWPSSAKSSSDLIQVVPGNC